MIRLSSHEPMVCKVCCQIYCANVSFEVALSHVGLAYARFHLRVKSHFVHDFIPTVLMIQSLAKHSSEISEAYQHHSYIFDSLQLPTSRNAVAEPSLSQYHPL